ncbi:extradiol ring-cleavage dioxygenase [Mycobacterium sp. CBMA271]|uniref:DODA-type extradiol aromatic ring-opening family dioxygenase n=1 Tax=unclassified Mycobacteroides TaxID=2618759 RepID=UPI0012DF9480|nr:MULTISPECIES: extradiol ring-cleavage dioxygenase [unclassified Mycobacteroides]MUM18863.1 extradiol ring-cleavage dioxygenase [Mycobacteroides sp. CBMA 326]MUM23197.1 extradiol ring-cleavage dioxygenase [Mycobacteroides sp. CBMA 271]
MAQFLGLGLTHYPLLTVPDPHMADLLRWTLTDPGIPEAEKDSSHWPELMQREWGDDGGTAAAGGHRHELLKGMRRCREALDAFQPDVVVVWGDDQYENFREEVVPPFCVLAYGQSEVEAFAVMNERGVPNVWGLPDDTTFTLRGDQAGARQLANDLIEDGFDIAYSYQKREGTHFPHAIANTQLFLDYAHAGRQFPYPILPITVNCYGQHAIVRRGGLARFAEIHDERLDPVGPSPSRCYALGAAVARALNHTNKRVALVASSSWSHAFLNDKAWHLRPDTDADRRLYDAFVRRDWATWNGTASRDLVDAGQHEMLNWFCLAGAMEELGLGLSWSSFVTTDVFNSNKCFAVFNAAAPA